MTSEENQKSNKRGGVDVYLALESRFPLERAREREKERELID